MNNSYRSKISKENTKSKAILILLLNIVISIIIFYVAWQDVSKINYDKMLLIANLIYIWIFISWYKVFNSCINSYLIFVACTYMFYFGQHFLYVIGIPLDRGRTIANTYSVQQYNTVAFFILLCMLLIHIGAFIATITTRNLNTQLSYEINDSINKKIEIKALKIVSIFLLVISYLPTVIIRSNYIKIILSSGYGSVFLSDYYELGGFSNIPGFMSTFIIPALIMAILAFKDSKSFKFISFLAIVYILLYFLSGSRYDAVLFIVTLILAKKYYFGGLNRKSLFKIGVGGVLLITMISLVSSIRSELSKTSNYLSLVSDILINLYENNILFSFIKEMGFTMVATATVFVYCPSSIQYVYGETYFASFLRLFPNLFWDAHPAANVSVDSVFKSFLTSSGGIGSSFIAEAYYNFGYSSLLLMPIIGIALFKLFNKMEIASKSDDRAKGFLTLYIFCFTLFFVRTDTVAFWRNLAYYGIFPYVMFYIVKKSITSKLKFRKE